jgi:RNA-directed DNA polymerase
VNWIVDADIAGFFDAVSHEWLMRFVEHRIGDRRMNRLVRKWLKAGVMEEGELVSAEVGTPQGAVSTPQTHLVNSSFRSACPLCDGIGIWVLDIMP